jgi:hypothetical protein
MSAEEKHLEIQFNNGTSMSLAFPTQIKNSMGALVEVSKRILESDKLVIEAGKELLIIPWASVQYVAVNAVPSAALPIGTIKGARRIDSSPAKE